MIIVSGLPRSGTSMMCQILEAGGLEIITDNIRKADEDNPKGYFEDERVKQLDQNNSWLKDLKENQVIKILYHCLKHLPTNKYKVIFMLRDVHQIAKSQQKMIENKREHLHFSTDKVRKIFNRELQNIEKWMQDQPHLKVLFIQHSKIINNPSKEIEEICTFLNKDLDQTKMSSVIDKSLYRQK